MEKQNKEYELQSLDEAKQIIAKMLAEKNRVTTIYSSLRDKANLSLIGDWPIVKIIASTASELRYKVSKQEYVKLLQNARDGEFKNINANSPFIAQLYA